MRITTCWGKRIHHINNVDFCVTCQSIRGLFFHGSVVICPLQLEWIVLCKCDVSDFKQYVESCFPFLHFLVPIMI